MAAVLVCDGQVYTDAGAPQCSTGWQIAEYMPYQPFDPATLDPVLIAGAVGAGFFVLLPVWAAAISVQLLLSAIKGS